MKLWIARDKDGSLCLYYEEPYKCRGFFLCDMNNGMWLDRTLFPEVTFENSPQEVELKLVNGL